MAFKGTASIIELPTGKSFDPKNGWSVTRKFRGTPTAIAAKINELIYDGCKITHDPPEEGGWETINCLYSWDPTDPQNQNPDLPISDIWALAGNQLEKKLWEMPKVVAELNKIEDDGEELEKTAIRQVAFLRKFIEATIQGEAEIIDPFTNTRVPINSNNLAKLLDGTDIDTTVIAGLMTSLAKGVDSYPVSQYVLRRQTTIGPFCNIRANYANVGKVYTSAALDTAEEIPEEARIVLPAGIWLKQTPTLEQIGLGKWQITQEWWHADYYDPFIYESAV